PEGSGGSFRESGVHTRSGCGIRRPGANRQRPPGTAGYGGHAPACNRTTGETGTTPSTAFPPPETAEARRQRVRPLPSRGVRALPSACRGRSAPGKPSPRSGKLPASPPPSGRTAPREEWRDRCCPPPPQENGRHKEPACPSKRFRADTGRGLPNRTRPPESDSSGSLPVSGELILSQESEIGPGGPLFPLDGFSYTIDERNRWTRKGKFTPGHPCRRGGFQKWSD